MRSLDGKRETPWRIRKINTPGQHSHRPVLFFTFLKQSIPGPRAAHSRSLRLRSLFLPSFRPSIRLWRSQRGSETTAIVLRGHPLLVHAAIDSVRNSKFEWRNCTDEAVFYRLTYSFELGPTSYCTETTNGIKENLLSGCRLPSGKPAESFQRLGGLHGQQKLAQLVGHRGRYAVPDKVALALCRESAQVACHSYMVVVCTVIPYT
jgi:hypothetical protein